MEFDPRPGPQQLLAAVVRGLRLQQALTASKGTRISFEGGRRVKPATRETYVNDIAQILVDLGFPRLIEANDPLGAGKMVEAVAGAIAADCVMLEQCQSYLGSYGRRDGDPLLQLLPPLRLQLQSLGVRLSLHMLPRYHRLALVILDEGPAALADGNAFWRFVRFLLSERGLRRKELHGTSIPESTWERWESGELPQSAKLEVLAEAVGRDLRDQKTIELDLRIIVAFDHLWRWLDEAGLPRAHRIRLGQSFIKWAVSFGTLFVQSVEGGPEEKEDARLLGVLYGARHPPIARALKGLAATVPDVGFARDLVGLGSNWLPALKYWHGFLDPETGAADVRRAREDLPLGGGDRDTVAWLYVCFDLPMIDEVAAKQAVVDDPLAEFEGSAQAQLEGGRPDIAERTLRLALRTYGDEPWLHIKLALALEAQGRAEEAVEEVLIAQRLDVEIPDAHLLHARLTVSLGRHEEALGALSRANELRPDDPVNHEWRGGTLLLLGDVEGALEAFRAARTANPRHLAGWQGETRCLISLGRQKEARAAAKEAAHLGDRWIMELVRGGGG